jgi:ADP-dependent NAD(P)H-hydrate dehydratase / NAD(P)H-hydrate epimerase
MRNAYPVAQVREAERALMARLPDGALMQRAAAGLASVCAGLLGTVYGSRVVVLAGSGDNGGDALYAGARLAARGAVVTAIAAGSRVHAAGMAALQGAGGRLVEAAGAAGEHAGAAGEHAGAVGEHAGAAGEQAGASGEPVAAGRPGTIPAVAGDAIDQADLVIDGLLGIGGRGALREPAASLAARSGQCRATVVAVDLPSGVDADTGEVVGAAVRADVTVTFGAYKPGLLIDPGAEHAGVVELIDIGLGADLGLPRVTALQAADVAALLPTPSTESDKYRRGVLGVLAGSERFTGAATLAVGGAIRGGAGMVRLVTAEAAAAVARQHWPEAVLTVTQPGEPADQVLEVAGRVQAWVAGPGIGTDDAAAALLTAVLRSSVPVLVDADGLTLLAAHRHLLPRAEPTLITPHAGELARLLGAERDEIEASRLRFATQAAAQLGVTVLLKGSTTLIAAASDEEPVLVNPTGTSWLATAGSGDVLSGLTGALLAQGLPPREAAAVGAYLHGVAARQAADGAPIGASDLIQALQGATRTVRG